jgi:hypothetical protein
MTQSAVEPIRCRRLARSNELVRPLQLSLVG